MDRRRLQGLTSRRLRSAKPARITMTVAIIIAASANFAPAVLARGAEQTIKTFDFTRYLNSKYPECVRERGHRNAVNVLSLSFYDFTHDGSEEAMLIGSSCRTGTAGPDIHSVYRLNMSGRIQELKIRQAQSFKGHPLYGDLVGNRNYVFAVQNGLLCEVFTDDSGRERPLTVCYKLVGDQFVLDHVERGPVYPTSFNCTTVDVPWAKAVCGNRDLAAADRQMLEVYQELLQRRPDVKPQLEAKQSAWRASLDAVKPTKGFGEYLQEMYADRIAELRAELQKGDRSDMLLGISSQMHANHESPVKCHVIVPNKQRAALNATITPFQR